MRNIEKLLWVLIIFNFYFDAFFTYFIILPYFKEWNIVLSTLIKLFGARIVFVLPIIYIPTLFYLVNREKDEKKRTIHTGGLVIFTSILVIDYIVLWLSGFKVGVDAGLLYLSCCLGTIVYFLVMERLSKIKNT